MTIVRSVIRRSDEEIWYWYEMIDKFKRSYLSKPQFCQENKIEAKMFQNMYYRISYKEDSNPEEYKKMVDLARKFLASGDKLKEFAKRHKISESQLASVVTHLSYMKIIEKMKESKKASPTGFVEVPQNVETREFAPHQMIQLSPPINQPPEVVEKKNDLELIICKGVRVIISPGLEPMKVIKIIELLQEL